jgi:hypothetical protein
MQAVEIGDASIAAVADLRHVVERLAEEAAQRLGGGERGTDQLVGGLVVASVPWGSG